MEQYVQSHLEGENEPEVFGEQVVVDEDDEPVALCPHLLIGATDLSIEAIVRAIHDRAGCAIAAHVDRERFSILGQLGFIPSGLDLDGSNIHPGSRPTTRGGDSATGAGGVWCVARTRIGERTWRRVHPAGTGRADGRRDSTGAAAGTRPRDVLKGKTFMQDLSLHILDIAENSVRAGATRVEVELCEDSAADRLDLRISDNGRGWTRMLRRRRCARSRRRAPNGASVWDCRCWRRRRARPTATARSRRNQAKERPSPRISDTATSIASDRRFAGDVRDARHRISRRGFCVSRETRRRKRTVRYARDRDRRSEPRRDAQNRQTGAPLMCAHGEITESQVQEIIDRWAHGQVRDRDASGRAEARPTPAARRAAAGFPRDGRIDEPPVSPGDVLQGVQPDAARPQRGQRLPGDGVSRAGQRARAGSVFAASGHRGRARPRPTTNSRSKRCSVSAVADWRR